MMLRVSGYEVVLWESSGGAPQDPELQAPDKWVQPPSPDTFVLLHS